MNNTEDVNHRINQYVAINSTFLQVDKIHYIHLFEVHNFMDFEKTAITEKGRCLYDILGISGLLLRSQ